MVKFIYLQIKSQAMTRKRMTKDEILKLKAVALYVVNKFEAIDILPLFKIIYFADREHYAVYGRRIIGDTYCALKNGPVPSFLYDAIKVLNGGYTNTDLQIISNSLQIPDKEFAYIISALEIPDMDELSASDIEMLNKSISENGSLPIHTLSRKSHDFAWESAWKKAQNSPIDPILMARAAGASDATIEYILENEFFDKIIEA